MKSAELAGKTVAQLKELAKRRKVALPADAKKVDILRVLTRAVESAKGGAKGKTKTKTKAQGKAKAKTKVKKRTETATTTKKRTKTGSAGVRAETAKTAGKAKAARKRSSARAEEWRISQGAGEPLMAQERVEDAKYFTGPPERQHPFLRSLPVEYGEERVALLARDPDTVFGYWEVPQDRFTRERARTGKKSRLCLRIYDVTGVQFDGTNATSFFDQEVYERVGSWYFDLRRPGHAFCADIGLRTPDGRFLTIARSNVLLMPRASVSDMIEEEWSLTEQQLLPLFGTGARVVGGISSMQLWELLRQRRRAEISSPGVSSWSMQGRGRE